MSFPVYIRLWGPEISRDRRFDMMNTLENHFWRYGKITDLYRLKPEYTFLGDFVIEYESRGGQERCLNDHHATTKHYLSSSTLPTFEMEVDALRY